MNKTIQKVSFALNVRMIKATGKLRNYMIGRVIEFFIVIISM
jgi:hypothetical protein